MGTTIKYILKDCTVPVRKWSRLIIYHAESANTGFIHESKWVFQSQSTRDYHEEMTAHTFRDCFLTRFINYLEEGSIIIMDNASNLSIRVNMQLQERRRYHWMATGESNWCLSHWNKSELLELVFQFRNNMEYYELEECRLLGCGAV
jgi:hypothetical protein